MPNNSNLVRSNAQMPSLKPELVSYKSFQDIPDFSSIYTAGAYSLSNDAKKGIIVLESDTGNTHKRFFLIFDPVVRRNNMSEYMELKAALDELQAIVIIGESNENIIQAIYENYENTNNSSDNDDVHEIEREFDRLIEYALNNKASDIYLIVQGNNAEVRLQIHKKEIKSYTLPKTKAMALMRIAYTIADEDSKAEATFDPSINQQASITRLISNQLLKIRYQTLVIWPSGIEMICRTLKDDKDNSRVPLESLGFSGRSVDRILKALARPDGVIAIAGPTGSGKTTSLKHFVTEIDYLRRGEAVIRTLEDPPEYRMKARQTPVLRRKSEKGNPFAEAINAVLRSAFHVMMAGEIRDKESAQMLQQVIESGHQVLGTIHSVSAIGIIGRLETLGMNREVMLSPGFVSALVFQRLIPVYCPHCAELPNESLLKHVSFMDETHIERIKVSKQGGCEHCNNLGTIGMTVCAEVIIPDSELLSILLQRNDAKAREYWLTKLDGMTAAQHGIIKLLTGQVGLDGYITGFGFPEKEDYLRMKSSPILG
jgi:type II secretory ATPase GspE/PulE/Tfp pilus assembly ATPase PilB-like protein